MNSPFADLSPDEQRAMLARSSSGEYPIFEGEEAGGPQVANRHKVHSGQYFEAEPEQLIEVAKSIASDGEGAQKTIERAYALICEAHLVSRNIRHWNEKTRRNHVKKSIHEIVEQCVVREGLDEGKVPRAKVLSAFLKSKGRSSNETDDRKLFNRWIHQTLRMDSYKNEIPWNPVRDDFDQALSKILQEKGWIRWFNLGSSGYLLLPEESEMPLTKSRRKLRDGEHVTRPWWETKNVWWPSPTKAEVKRFKDEYLSDKGKNFRSEYAAKKALERFDRWLEVEKSFSERHPQSRKSASRDSETGRFD